MNNEYIAVKKEDLRAFIGYVHTLFDFIDVESFTNKKNVVLVNGGYDDFVKPIESFLRDGNSVGDEILAKDVDIRLFKEQLSDIYDYDVANITDKQLTELYDEVQGCLSGDDTYSDIYNNAVHSVMAGFVEKTKTGSLLDNIKQAEAIKESNVALDIEFTKNVDRER